MGHACLERTFSFRHRGVFSLENKIGVSVSTSRNNSENDPVQAMIQRFMLSNKMNVIGHVAAEGYDQCYTCGFGHDCDVGNVVRKYGVLEKIEKEHYPPDFVEQDQTLRQVHKIAELLRNQLAIA